jgi:hypothetical protein
MLAARSGQRMMAIALDTLAYSRHLREAGISEQQANAHAEALAAAMTDTLATKQDLRELETRLDARLAALEARFSRVDDRFEYLEKHLDARLAEHTARFDGRLSDLERRMTIRLGGIVVAGFGVVSVLVKLL